MMSTAAKILPASVWGAFTGPMPPSSIEAFRNASIQPRCSKAAYPAMPGVPARVVTFPSGVILRIVWFSVSAT